MSLPVLPQKSSRRARHESLPTWGVWLIFSVLVAIAILLLALSGALTMAHDFLDQAVPAVSMLVAIAVVYFLPAIIAWNTKRHGAIAVANLLFGWTGIGWAAILVWAVAEQNSKPKTNP